MKKSLFLFSIFFLPLTVFSEELNNQNAFWWVKNYGELSRQEEPLVERAGNIFKKIASTAGAEANLLIIRGKEDPWAVAIQDGSIILTEGALKACYRNVSKEKGDSRLGFLLGHEIAHQVKNDFWHSAAFFAVKKYSHKNEVKRNILSLFKKTTDAYGQSVSSLRVIRMKELQADSYGLLYMTMAGYQPAHIVHDDQVNFFEEWVKQVTGDIAYEDSAHPGPKERAEFLKAQLKPVAETLSYFQLGTRFYQIGRYRDAISLFESFKKQFPGREVYNNIGVSSYQLAMKTLYNCNKDLALDFKLATALDMNTRGKQLTLRGSSSGKPCLEKRVYKKALKKAIKNLRISIEKDPAYLPAKINLSSALIMAGSFTEAMSVADEALKIALGHYGALNNRAVALFGFGKKNNIDTTQQAIKILENLSAREEAGDALYNLGVLYSKAASPEKAQDARERYLELNRSGPYALRVATLQKKTTRGTKPKRGKEPPLPLGRISPQVREELASMKPVEIKTGGIRGRLYQTPALMALSIGDRLEFVDETLKTPVPFKEWKEKYGEPDRLVTDATGKAGIFKKYGVEIRNGRVVNIFYFNSL